MRRCEDGKMTGREDVRMGGWQMGRGEDRRVEGQDGKMSMREGLSSCRAPEDVSRGG
jgi:hypothetical protein